MTKKKRPDSRTLEKTSSPHTTNVTPKGRRTGFIIAAVVAILILVIVGAGYYFSEDAKYRRLTIVTVDDVPIKMPYFLKRVRLAGVNNWTMLQTLSNEQFIKQVAPQYIGEVTPEELDQGLRMAARGGSENISENEFKEWYRQQLNESGLSDEEYKEIVHISLLSARLHEYLAERVSTVAEQLHLHIILLNKFEDAEKVRARWEAGEDFVDLAREVSIDEQARENGGDIGWWPRGVLTPQIDYVAFNLSVGEVSEPLPLYPSPDASASEAEVETYYLLMLSEKDTARELNEDSLAVLRSSALENWLQEEAQYHEIKFYFNSEIDAWLNWQLQKNSPK